MKVTLYLINLYEAYRADEVGVRAMLRVPEDTMYYKSEVLEEAEVELPHEFELCETKGYGKAFFLGNEGAEMVTEIKKNGKLITSLVTSKGITPIYTWKYQD